MLNSGKCPKCEKTLTYVTVEHIDINQGFAKKWHGASYVCPHCHAILGVSLDPLALKTDTVKEVVKALRGK